MEHQHQNQATAYARSRKKAESFEALAFAIYQGAAAADAGVVYGQLHTDERKWLLEQLGDLAREVGDVPHELCERVASNINAALHRALTSSGHNRFDYIKMVVGNICTAARNLA